MKKEKTLKIKNIAQNNLIYLSQIWTNVDLTVEFTNYNQWKEQSLKSKDKN